MDSKQGTKFCQRGSFVRLLAVFSICSLITACTESPSGTVELNQEDGIVINAPSFLKGRAIIASNLEARVTVTVDGEDMPVTTSTSNSARWVGQVYVPESSNPTLTVTWVEVQVPNLAERSGTLPLAIYTSTMADSVDAHSSFVIPTEEYDIQSTAARPNPELDLDNDGTGNLAERQIGSDPNDATDVPQTVNILYVDESPSIDGNYDPIWNRAQFLNVDRNGLNIDNVLIGADLLEPGEDRGYSWAAMHNGQYLYLFVFGEAEGMQTPVGDSPENVYEDDSIDIYWDPNNSKGARYDNVDDSHVMIGLLSSSGTSNNSSIVGSRLQIGFNSANVAVGTFDYATCVCQGSRQTYEIRIDLQASGIPIDKTFGFEVNINNDFDGNSRDAKWAWFNDSGQDDTWEFPGRMGNVRLQSVP